MSTTWSASEEGIQLIKDRMGLKGLSQEALCGEVSNMNDDDVNLTRSTLTRLLKGKRIKSDVFKAICDSLNLDYKKVWQVRERLRDGGIYYTNLENMPEVPIFDGREKLLGELISQINNNKRMVVVSGISRIGKTSLLVKVFNHFKETQSKFKNLIWIDLKHPKPLQELINDILQPENQLNEASNTNDREIDRLINFLKKESCLIVLDNWNALFKECELAGCYQESFQNYGNLLRRITEILHNSCIIIATSQLSMEVKELSTKSSFSHIKLSGLDLNNNPETREREIINDCKNQPQALPLLFASLDFPDISSKENMNIFSHQDIIDLENWSELQYESLSDIEKTIILYFTINNKAAEEEDLFKENILNEFRVIPRDIREGLSSLRRRDFIDEENYPIINARKFLLYHSEQKLVDDFINELGKISILDISEITRPNYLMEHIINNNARQTPIKLEIQRQIKQIIELEIPVPEKISKFRELLLSKTHNQ